MPTFRSFAKINWHLEVVRRREDGFHELRTLFQTIDLHDEIEIDLTSGESGARLEVSGAELAADESNLALRAAVLYLQDWGEPRDGVRIRLRKRIPLGAGLGGGSSNAATVLMALSEMIRRPDPGWMRQAAGRLGADVPFFLVGGLALGTERGDRLRPLADDRLPEREIWLACPRLALSTAAVFRALGPVAGEVEIGLPVRCALSGEPLPPPSSRWYRNDLEPAALGLSAELTAVYTALERSGAELVRMSGSGSTLFGCYSASALAAAAASRLPAGTDWIRARTLGRSNWRRAAGFGANRGEV